jgi:hypothetical protein
MLKLITKISLSVLFTAPHAWGAPHTFTPQDALYYTINLQGRDRDNGKTYVSPYKLLEINLYDPSRLPPGSRFTPPSQYLNVSTKGGSVVVNRPDNQGIAATRDVWDEKNRFGTKELEVRFQNATCTDVAGVSSPCSANLLLSTRKPDFRNGPIFEPRTLVITTSIGQTFRFRSGRQDISKRLRLPPSRRALSIGNFAGEKINFAVR